MKEVTISYAIEANDGSAIMTARTIELTAGSIKRLNPANPDKDERVEAVYTVQCLLNSIEDMLDHHYYIMDSIESIINDETGEELLPEGRAPQYDRQTA